jgi:DNA-binding response OmpR family regulator
MARALLIEDDRPHMKLLAWGLIDAGHGVSVARTATEGIRMLQAIRVDAIIFNARLADDVKRNAMTQMRGLVAPGVRVIDVTESGGDKIGADWSFVARHTSLNEIIRALEAA